MNEYGSRDPRLLTFHARGSWFQRALLALASVALAIVAFFFLTIALIAAAFIALAIGVRWWWTLRRLRSEAKASAAIEGEYTVIEKAPAIERESRR